MRTARYRQKSIVGGRFRSQRPIEGEIDRRLSIEGEIWSIEGEQGKKKTKEEKKKKRRGEEENLASSSPAHRRSPIVRTTGASSQGERPRLFFLSREETERLPARGERSRRPFFSLYRDHPRSTEQSDSSARTADLWGNLRILADGIVSFWRKM
ncbi:hypothetical protein BHM03_00010719 [Ensete ventricosum]|nr:hypothetical protein BHM03_00010719 [Ensete ventricosum]